jgi:DNA-binding NarL/FixJ family response regulator
LGWYGVCASAEGVGVPVWAWAGEVCAAAQTGSIEKNRAKFRSFMLSYRLDGRCTNVTPVISLLLRPFAGLAVAAILMAVSSYKDQLMKAAMAKKPLIRIAVVESDPLRFVGFRALFDSESDFELVSATLPDISTLQGIDLVLLGSRAGQNLFDVMASLKAARPDLRIIVTGAGIDEETILKAIASGAKGYVDEAATPAEFVQAIRIVNQGSVWAPRRVLSMFIERVSSSPGRIFPAGRVTFTDREKEVLEMLVAGRSNKEIGAALGIEERTVKAHVAKLMRKVGVQNRIALSVHAITQSLVSAK